MRYIAQIPAVLALTGIGSWIIGDDVGMLLASGVATAVTIYVAWDWLIRRGPTRYSTILALALLFGYGTGTLNTWFTLPRGSVSMADYLGLNQGILTRGMAAALLATVPLFLIGEMFERPIFGRDFRFVFDPRIRTLTYLGAIAMLTGYFTHSLAFEGTASSNGHVSIPGVFLSWLYAPLTAMTVAGFLTAQNRKDKVLGALSSLTLLMLFSVMGRRVTLYTVVEIIFVLGIIRFSWRGNLIRKLLLVGVMGAIIVFGALTFMLLRIASTTTRQKHLTVDQRINVAGKMVQKGGAYALATERTQQNVATRSLVLGFFANVLDASSRMTPALGKDVAGYFQFAIPSIIHPDKDRSFAEERLVDQQFGFSYGDEANSVITAGATDFGLVGVLVYPLLFVGLFRFVHNLFSRWFSTVPLLFISLSFIYMMMQTETGLTGYFETLRDAGLFGMVLAAFLALPRFRMNS
jgi:hypothetical protein